jgi:hypothetical protein
MKINTCNLFSYLGMKSTAGFMEAPAFAPKVIVIVATERPTSRAGGVWPWSSTEQTTRSRMKVATPWSKLS